jgi:signal transduction histidine kinase
MATEQQQLLAQLAQRLRRPVHGMAAFEDLSAEEIQQLMGYISQACEREQAAVRQDRRMVRSDQFTEKRAVYNEYE